MLIWKQTLKVNSLVNINKVKHIILHNAINGILLRTPDAELSAMPRHRGYHSVYNDVVRNELNKLDVNQSVDVLQKQVFNLQSDLRRLQESGLPLYPSQGATVDLWERSLSRTRK